MRIQQLWDRHAGQDIWVVGTGPSLRVLPRSVLENRILIGLNQAWKLGIAPTYMLTVHPELYLDYLNAPNPPATTWIVKRKAPLANISLDDPRCYVFDTSTHENAVRQRLPDTLYLGRGIQATAIALAAHMGAKNVFLTGCDAATLGGDHHAHEQHVRYHGLDPSEVFEEYRQETDRVRRWVREAFGVGVVTVTPFVSVTHVEQDYQRLCQQLGVRPLPPPKDTSFYLRMKKS